jgi:hypothetical protein
VGIAGYPSDLGTDRDAGGVAVRPVKKFWNRLYVIFIVALLLMAIATPILFAK